MLRTIERTYEVWDEEALEAGDTDDRGTDGIVWTEDKDEDPVQDAVRFLQREGANEASCAPQWSPGTWYSSTAEDYMDGTHTMSSYHLEGFSEDEERTIYAAITRRSP